MKPHKNNPRPGPRPSGNATPAPRPPAPNVSRTPRPPAPLPPRAPAGTPPKPTHWDNVAEWYDTLVGDQGSEYHQKIILPGILRMLADRGEPAPVGGPGGPAPTRKHPLGGMRVLDLACGQGVLCRNLAAAGARVLGVDAAPGLIEAATRRNKTDALSIDYRVADVTKLAPLPEWIAPGGFDLVTVVLAVQNITPLSPLWHACHDALAPNGQLIVVMMHPCFRVFKQSDWHWDNATQSQARLVRQYLSSSKAQIQMRPGQAASGGPGADTVSFNRPLQAYVNTLANARLVIDHMEEWTSHRHPPAGVRFDALETARREIPLFLALRARKLAPPSP